MQSSNRNSFFLQITIQLGVNYSALFRLRFYYILTPKVIEFAMYSLTQHFVKCMNIAIFSLALRCQKQLPEFCKIVKKKEQTMNCIFNLFKFEEKNNC